MKEKLNRKDVSFENSKDHQKHDQKYWKKASNEKKFAAITYLRECFYRPEATTGRLQKVYTFIKRKPR